MKIFEPENFTRAFWARLDTLVATCHLQIERPRGTPHPKYPDLVYPFDYGFLEGTTSDDGEGIDVWLGSSPEGRITALLCAIDPEKRDLEVKLLLGCTRQDSELILNFQNAGVRSAILIERGGA